MGDIRILFQGDKLVGEALRMGEGLEQAAGGNQDKHIDCVCTEGSNWFRWSQRGPTKRTAYGVSVRSDQGPRRSGQ